jgi:hypothetical protein
MQFDLLIFVLLSESLSIQSSFTNFMLFPHFIEEDDPLLQTGQNFANMFDLQMINYQVNISTFFTITACVS